jgi:hypothetical protein
MIADANVIAVEKRLELLEQGMVNGGRAHR